MKGKKLVSILLTGCLCAVGLMGCNKGSADSKASADGSVQLEMWHTFSEEETKVFEDKVIPAFNEKYPDIKIKATRMPAGDDFQQQLVQAISGNATPDLARMDIVDVPKYAKLGALLPVDDQEGFNEIKDKLYEAPMSTSLYKDKYYGIPLDTNTKIAIYNKSLLEKAGVKEAPKTFDDLVKIGQKVKGDETYPLTIQGLTSWAWAPYFLTFGGEFTDKDNQKASGYLNSDKSVAAMQKIIDLYNQGMFGDSVLGGLGTWEGLKGNNYMMIDEGSWWFPANSDFKDNVVYAPFPTVDGKSTEVIGGEDTVVFKSCKNKEAANKFAQFLASDEAQTIFCEELNMLPVNKDTAKKDCVTKNDLLKTYSKQLENAWARTPNPNWGDIDIVLQKTFEGCLRGDTDAKSGLDSAASQIDSLLQS